MTRRLPQPVTAEKVAAVLRLMQAGHTYAVIAFELDMPLGTVGCIANRLIKEGKVRGRSWITRAQPWKGDGLTQWERIKLLALKPEPAEQVIERARVALGETGDGRQSW